MGGLHTGYITFRYIEEYGKKQGELKMLEQFKGDIKKVLKLNLTSFEFLAISTYIYIRHFFEEKKFKIEWIPDEETKILIKKHYNSFLNQYEPSEEFNNRFPKENNGYFLRNIIAKYRQIKERFGIDLLG